MKNLSLFDREFLAKIHVDAKPRRFTDDLFLRACGVEALGGGKSSDGISRLLRIYVLDGTWPQDVADEREAELREEALYGRRFARFMKGCQETNIENLLAAYEQQVAHEAEIQACAERIAKHTAPGIPEDGTVRWLREAGIPVTPANWMRVQFMGNPPQPPFDGELDLPDWVRRAYEPAEETEPVCGLDNEDNEDEED
ncbi:MAG: hypothetical protein WCA19_01915 [Candidatus Acidiferrales bacterium]